MCALQSFHMHSQVLVGWVSWSSVAGILLALWISLAGQVSPELRSAVESRLISQVMPLHCKPRHVLLQRACQYMLGCPGRRLCMRAGRMGRRGETQRGGRHGMDGSPRPQAQRQGRPKFGGAGSSRIFTSASSWAVNGPCLVAGPKARAYAADPFACGHKHRERRRNGEDIKSVTKPLEIAATTKGTAVSRQRPWGKVCCGTAGQTRQRHDINTA